MATTVQTVDVSTGYVESYTFSRVHNKYGEERPRYDDWPKETYVPERASRRLRSARGFAARNARENG